MDRSQKDDFILHTFETFMDRSRDMIFVKDLNLVYLSVSTTFANMTGFGERETFVGKTDFDIFSALLAQKYTRDDRKVLETGEEVVNYVEPLPEQDGKRRYSSTSKYCIRNDKGEIIGLYGIARDVTELMELEAQRESSRLSRQMFDNVLEADLSNNTLLSTEESDWIALMGVNEESRFTQTIKEMADQFVHPDCVEAFLNYYDLEKLRSNYNYGIADFEHLTLLRRDLNTQQYRWVEFRSRVYHSRVSNTLRITIFLKDVDEQVRSKQKLLHEASIDALTGLYNRSNVLKQIGDFLAQEDCGQTHALLFIDLDSFKQINDSWGHQFGDHVLKNTADRLREIFRNDDVFGRIGGDEFLVFLRNVSSKQAVEQRAHEVIRALPCSYDKDNQQIRVTCSVGIAMCRGGQVTAEQLYAHADEAMYRAKENGRDQLYFYGDIE